MRAAAGDRDARAHGPSALSRSGDSLDLLDRTTHEVAGRDRVALVRY